MKTGCSVPEEAKGVTACALCGLRFTHGGQACATCPLFAGCELVRCPRCGFQFPTSSRLLDWLRARFLKSGRTVPALVQPLLEIGDGEEARVLSVSSLDASLLLKLQALGLVPGAVVRLEQKAPAAVVHVGESTVAMQPSVAARIFVRRLAA